MTCPASFTGRDTGTNLFFREGSHELNATDRSTLAAIAAEWHNGGRVGILRIDGYASCDGSVDSNWVLSCQRAEAVAAELAAPKDGSPGVPTDRLLVLANGETDRFDNTSLTPNRRVVITYGGTPPPGPACGITISGPDEMDHYCAPYVPSERATCGIFPARAIKLTGTGGAAGTTLKWRISHGGSRAAIVGVTTGPTISVSGIAPSVTKGDVTVQATDGTCTSTHFLTVREPSAMAYATEPSSGPSFVELLVTYIVFDQFYQPMGPGICWDETITVCSSSHRSSSSTGDQETWGHGQVRDRLRLEDESGRPLPDSLCRKINQVITAGGCGPLARNTIVFQKSGVTLTPNDSCVAGSSCP